MKAFFLFLLINGEPFNVTTSYFNTEGQCEHIGNTWLTWVQEQQPHSWEANLYEFVCEDMEPMEEDEWFSHPSVEDTEV